MKGCVEGFRSRSLYESCYILLQKDLLQSRAAFRASLILQDQALTFMPRDHELRGQVHVMYSLNDIMIAGVWIRVRVIYCISADRMDQVL